MKSPRSDFPILARNPGLHYLDSAATTQKPRVVLDAMTAYYEQHNANPHRGAYILSVRATDEYHGARARVAALFALSDNDTLIFTRGTTESLNLLASSLERAQPALGPGDSIVVTGLEHHANFVPWQQLALRTGADFRICELTSDATIDLDHFESLINARTRVVAFAHVSNATGAIAPLSELVRIARERSDALIICDGAQSAPHIPVNFPALEVDAMAISGHKMLGPMGIGALIAKRALLDSLPPYQMGGDMIEYVMDDYSTWNVLPHKFEAGTPNVAGAVGLAAAADYVREFGMENVRAHELELLQLADARLRTLDGISIFGPHFSMRSGVVSFAHANIHPHDFATILDSRGVCIRAGHHCTQPLMRRLGVPATARASFHIYSTPADVEALADAVSEAIQLFSTPA